MSDHYPAVERRQQVELLPDRQRQDRRGAGADVIDLQSEELLSPANEPFRQRGHRCCDQQMILVRPVDRAQLRFPCLQAAEHFAVGEGLDDDAAAVAFGLHEGDAGAVRRQGYFLQVGQSPVQLEGSGVRTCRAEQRDQQGQRRRAGNTCHSRQHTPVRLHPSRARHSYISLTAVRRDACQ